MAKNNGKYEYMKFDSRRKDFNNYLNHLNESDLKVDDFMEHFTAYVGHMSLSRVIGLYELYKKTLGISGHIGEIGVYKGASFFLFLKLVKIFEGESLTQVHGFDWFEGTVTDDIELKVDPLSYKGDYDEIKELIQLQGFKNSGFLHKMDVTKELSDFLNKNKHLQFKLFFLDAGLYKVVKSTLKLVWDRITPGGIVILDQFNHELAPGETMAVRELLPNVKVKTLPNIWMPTGYIIKK